MKRDVYCIKCGKKFEDVQFDENYRTHLRCDSCGHHFTLTIGFDEVQTGIPVYTSKELAELYKDAPTAAEMLKKA